MGINRRAAGTGQQTTPDGLAPLKGGPTRCALITGAGSGIGRAVARELYRREYRLILVGRNARDLVDTLAPGETVEHAVADVSAADALHSAFVAATRRLTYPDTAILCAAQHVRGFFLDTPEEQFTNMVTTNICGVANSLREVLPGMLNSRFGRIVVLGTLADENPMPGSVGYSASKGALHALVRGIAAEIDRSRYPDVLLNEMSPGSVVGAMSHFGRLPEDVVHEVVSLLELPSGGPHGAFFQGGKRRYPGESWKRAIKRKLSFLY